MPRRLLCAAILALLAAPAAFAADHGNLTIYHADNDALFSGGTEGVSDAGHALVHEQRTLDLQAGTHEIRIGRLPAALDPEAVEVGFGTGPGVTVLGRRVVLATDTAGGVLEGAVGSHVSVQTDGTAGATGAFSGVLVGASGSDLLVRTSDGIVHLVHRYASVALPPDAVSGGSSLLLDVDAKTSGPRNALLTYMTSGIGWRAAYTANLASGSACRMRFKPEASIANRSGRDYRDASIKLVAGQPNLGNGGLRLYSMARAPAPVEAQELSAIPIPAPLGDYRSFTLQGAVTLPTGTVTLTPLYQAGELSCQREYVVDDGGRGYPPRPNTNDYDGQDYQDRAIASNLSFDAPEALPAGTLRAWTRDHVGAPALLGQGSVADTPKGQRVSVQLGQSFDLRVSRERTAFNVEAKAHTMSESYRFTLTNGGDSTRTVTVREHPDRWREWKLVSSSIQPAKQTPQLLEFQVAVPAQGNASITYSVRYTWTAKDM